MTHRKIAALGLAGLLVLAACGDDEDDATATTAAAAETTTAVTDEPAAAALVKVVRAVRLLGAAVVITGIRPEVAAALVGLGIDTHDLTTLGSLQSGLRHVLRR